MDDMINRQDAIKAIRKCKFESDMPTDWYQGMETAQDIVNKVPSAETHDKRTETHGVCSDLISRADAIEAMCRECGNLEEYGDCSSCGCAEKNAIEELPSAEPQPKPISYIECANAMLKMWIDNVLTDGEYYRIMEKLNAKHMADMRGGDDSE